METKQATSDKTSDKNKRLIDANILVEKFLSLTLTVTGLRAGKGVILELLNKYRNGILQLINEQPTVDAAPVVHGYWFFTEYEYFDCSECGFVYCNGCECTREAREMLRNGDAYKYCPNCGAKMDGGASG